MVGPRDCLTYFAQYDRERQISYDIAHMQNLNNGTNKLIYKTETDSQILKTNLWLHWETWRWRDKLEAWD